MEIRAKISCLLFSCRSWRCPLGTNNSGSPAEKVSGTWIKYQGPERSVYGDKKIASKHAVCSRKPVFGDERIDYRPL